MLFEHGRGSGPRVDDRDYVFSWDSPLTMQIDSLRNEALDALNVALGEAGLARLPAVGN